MDHLQHLLCCAMLVVVFRMQGFNAVECVFLTLAIGVGKEFLDTAKPLGFVDYRDLIGDGYGIVLGLAALGAGADRALTAWWRGFDVAKSPVKRKAAARPTRGTYAVLRRPPLQRSLATALFR